jgi:hypothetical protein
MLEEVRIMNLLKALKQNNNARKLITEYRAFFLNLKKTNLLN